MHCTFELLLVWLLVYQGRKCTCVWNDFYADCLAGSWGEGCIYTCGECINGICDPVDGICTNGCKDGYKNTNLCNKSKAIINPETVAFTAVIECQRKHSGQVRFVYLRGTDTLS